MDIYYRVTSTFYPDGRVVAAITGSCQADTRPSSTRSKIPGADIYCDWMPYSEAINKVAESKTLPHKKK